MIVKVQMPIITTEKYLVCLIYNEDRSVLAEMSVTKELKKEMKGELKKYFNAHTDKKKFIILDEEAPEQSW